MDQTLFVVLPVILLVLGFPIFLILLATALVILLTTTSMPPGVIQTVMFGSLGSFPLVAIPFFILAGEIMGQGGIAKRIVAWVLSLVGGVQGSLALATIASSELFGAMSGSAVGCVAAVGRLLLPALNENGYGERFSISLITCSGAIAIIIPPSIAMIIYAVTAQQSLTVLFTAGILPAILIGAMEAVYVLIYARIRMVPITSRTRWKNIAVATKDASWALGTIVVIFGGIYGGVFTPTEAAGIAVVYSVFVAKFIYREVTWADLGRIVMSAASLTTQILLIVAAAGVFSWLLTLSGIPQHVVDFIRGTRCRTGSDAVDDELRPAVRGELSGTAGGDPHPGAALRAGRRGDERQPHPLRRDLCRQSEHRHVHAAVRAEHLCGASDVQGADQPDLSRRVAVRGHQSHRPHDHHLRADHFHGAAESS